MHGKRPRQFPRAQGSQGQSPRSELRPWVGDPSIPYLGIRRRVVGSPLAKVFPSVTPNSAIRKRQKTILSSEVGTIQVDDSEQ